MCIGDRDLLLLQVHALAACDEPRIEQELQHGYQRLVEFVARRSEAQPPAVQHFFARGQLCHLVTALGLAGGPDGGPAEDASARTLADGIRHFDPQPLVQP